MGPSDNTRTIPGRYILDRRSWQLGPDAVWRRTEEILGVPGTIDAQEELKERALAASTVIAVPRRPAPGAGSLDPRA